MNRTRQEMAVGDALQAVAADGGVRAFFLAGPENECVDEFVDRLRRHSCAAFLGHSWHDVSVEWPDVAPANFAQEYRRQLLHQLRLPMAGTEADLATALNRQARPVAVVSRLYASDWRAYEDRRVAAWLELWRRLADQPARFAALPILLLKMPEAAPGWEVVPRGTAEGAAMSNAGIWRAVERLGGKPGFMAGLFGPPLARAPLSAPPVLHPIRKSHADEWRDAIADQLAERKADAVARIDALFAARRAIRHGVALKDFASSMLPLFRGTT